MKFAIGQIKQCKAINIKCSNCDKPGHFVEVCHQKKIHIIEAEDDETENFLPVEYLEC